jgi:hypothetical protein
LRIISVEEEIEANEANAPINNNEELPEDYDEQLYLEDSTSGQRGVT